jgi:uncharacterized protein
MTDAVLGPVQPHERIQLVDVLRGFALLGILQVNWTWAHTSGVWSHMIEFFAEGSFYTSYSFLFGLGFAIQMIRAEEAQRPFLVRYLWRTTILFLIGAGHFIFIWTGDILRDYALIAPVLLLVRRVRPAVIVALAGVVLVFTMAPFASRSGNGDALRRVNPEQGEADRVLMWVTVGNTYAHPPAWCRIVPGLTDAYRADVCFWAASVRHQVAQQYTRLDWWHGWDSSILCMFLLGLYVGRRRLLRDTARHTRLLLWVAGVSLVFGLAGNGLSVYDKFLAGKGIALPDGIARWVSDYYIGNIGLALFYLSGVTLLFTHWRWAARALAPLANVGRMGLTNYLMQGIIFSSMLGRHGFDVMRDVKAGYGVALINGVFVVQILYSYWWFKHFQFGPVEWAWRSLTWWRLQPMRKALPDASGGAT